MITKPEVIVQTEYRKLSKLVGHFRFRISRNRRFQIRV